MRALALALLLLFPGAPAQAQSCLSGGQPCNAVTPCPVAPLGDTLNGSVGQSACYIPMDSTRPTAVQAQNTTLNADCTWAVTFGRPFTSGSPIVHASLILQVGATQPIPCLPISRSTTAASGKCFPGQTTALNLAAVTAGLTLSPFGSTCTAGTTVMVVGREPTF